MKTPPQDNSGVVAAMAIHEEVVKGNTPSRGPHFQIGNKYTDTNQVVNYFGGIARRLLGNNFTIW